MFGQGSAESFRYSFHGAADGAVPYGLALSKQGKLYGTTQLRGNGPCSSTYQSCGTIFEATPADGTGGTSTEAWERRVIYTFQGGSDGANPFAPLVLDKAGNLYGTTTDGGGTACGGFGCGTVFELQRTPNGWVETVLYRFTGGDDGATPESSLILDSQGNIFGTTFNGGLRECGGNHGPCGVVYELEHSASGWNEKVLHSFDFKDGAQPIGGLTLDSAGNLFGTTPYGGLPYPPEGAGTIFALRPNNAGWQFEVLYSFPQLNGGPTATMVLDGQGNLYGVANGGGGLAYGSVFELHSPSKGKTSWNFSTLYSFTLGHDGGFPFGGIVFDSFGNLYGTTSAGGTVGLCQAGCGVVFELTPSSDNSWIESVLYSFQGGSDGINPNSTPVLDPWGNLYGTTAYGGDTNCVPFLNYSGCGTVFRISHATGQP